jgi:hypothetical protein
VADSELVIGFEYPPADKTEEAVDVCQVRLRSDKVVFLERLAYLVDDQEEEQVPKEDVACGQARAICTTASGWPAS